LFSLLFASLLSSLFLGETPLRLFFVFLFLGVLDREHEFGVHLPEEVFHRLVAAAVARRRLVLLPLAVRLRPARKNKRGVG
jgi:hypothetical protein